MKRKISAVIMVAVFLAGLAYGASEPNDATAQDLSTLRKKLSRVKREMDLLIKDMVSGASMASDAVMKDFASDVSVDILQNENSVIVKADLPGMEKDKINITLESGRFLKISGSREMSKSVSEPGVVRQERFFGSFEKTVELPCEVENSGINATYKDGVLEVTIPKKAPAKENKVKINVK
ncbi:MAG: Hsp20/alpha crystallin family protein [Candidatus Omnitrophica bacterium]|nr:Hsp20/alpha crystallin family protein [Candidatus Omnitrophota bacterium]